MDKHNNNRSSSGAVRYLKPLLIFGYGLIILIAIAVVSRLAIKKTDTVLKNKVSSLTSSLNVQMKLNLNSYLERMETISALVFASEEAYTYDATANNDEYEALETESLISDKLYDLCIMENFVDYGIVYSNNHTVGKISNGTKDQFGDNLYDLLSSVITNERTNDGWAAGFRGNFKRIYYVKRVHENAVLVVSFYSSELESVFDNPEVIEDMEVRLTNANLDIIYSSVSDDEIGKFPPEHILDYAKAQKSSTIMDNDYLITVSECADDWFVICSIPTEIILSEKNDVYKYIYIVAIIVFIIAVIIGTILSIQITNPITDVVTTLDTKAHIDQLTGIFNKRSFEEYADRRLAENRPNESHALILIDLDNFKDINDNFGHAEGDAVLSRVGDILKRNFSENDFLGRLGGDEFGVFINYEGKDRSKFKKLAKKKCDDLLNSFRSEFNGDDGTVKLSASIGAAVHPENGRTFHELYDHSDTALYTSKKRGKNTYTFYEKYLEGVLKK